MRNTRFEDTIVRSGEWRRSVRETEVDFCVYAFPSGGEEKTEIAGVLRIDRGTEAAYYDEILDFGIKKKY